MPRKPKAIRDQASAFRLYVTGEWAKNTIHKCEDRKNKKFRQYILRNAPFSGRFQKRDDWSGFVQEGMNIFQNNSEVYSLFEAFMQEIHSAADAMRANHQERRRIVNALGLRNKAGKTWIAEILNQASCFQEAAVTIQKIFGADLILRERQYIKSVLKDHPGKKAHSFKRYSSLVEIVKDNDPAHTILCTESAGFLVISENRSAIIVSFDNNEGYRVELVILRHVPDDMRYSPPLLNWLKDSINRASNSRRNVRPTHGGDMTQLGLNNGPRHAHVLGWAASFTKKLTDKQKAAEDCDLIGGMSLFWALVKAFLPADVTAPVQNLLDSSYPTLATRNIPQGCGFSITVGETKFTFNEASRAPPEAIAARGYVAHSHTDRVCVPWAFGWTVARDVPRNRQLPKNIGSSFVDLGLRVVVKSAAATLMAFQPKEMHGTTQPHGVVTYNLVMTSTQRVQDAINQLEREGTNIKKYLQTNQHTGKDSV